MTWLQDRDELAIRRAVTSTVWRHRDLTVRPGWTLDLAILVDGEPIGMQSLAGFNRWPKRRNVGTSSWLAAPWQGQGIGTRTRAAVLDLAFRHLDAKAAMSWAVPANQRSIRISTALGYRLAGPADPADSLAEVKHELARSTWLEHRPPGIAPTAIHHARAVAALLDT